MLKEQVINCIRLLIRKSRFSPTLRRYFRPDPIQAAMDIGRERSWDDAAEFLLHNDGQYLLQDDAFHDIFRDDINTNIEYELLLTSLRKKIFLDNLIDLNNQIHSRTLVTLITQAHHNEFVWYVSEQEKDKINDITSRPINETIKNNPNDLILLSLYGRFGQFKDIPYDSHKDALLSKCDLPSDLKHLFLQLSTEHDEQKTIKNNIKKFADITNTTSINISQMYEEYPYPRWIKWNFPKPGARIQKLREFYNESELSFMNHPFRILVAGCGTGSKAIEYAIGYGKNAQITAVDLSLTSLSYAQWKANKLNIHNIDFIQMDLLDLPNIDKTFDIVECTGVLHHMKDPLEGARAIVAPIRKNGLVHISLYSELARRSIVYLREKYNLIPDSSNDEIRKKRLEIIANDAELVDNRLSLRWDFFDLNRCKDLLFHPLEHRYTIPKINSLLSELDLEFRGIEKPPLIQSQCWTHYPAQKHIRDFSKWNGFESKHPDAFGDLYEIWSIK